METPSTDDILKYMGKRKSITLMVAFEVQSLHTDLHDEAHVELEEALGEVLGTRPKIERDKTEIVHMGTEKNEMAGVHICHAVIEFYLDEDSQDGFDGTEIGVQSP